MQVTKNVRKIMRASFGTTANRTGVPNVCQALSSKLIAQTQAPLGTKFIFVASNFLAYHHIGINNYGYLIGAFQNAGAPVTSTQRNKEGFILFCSVQSDWSFSTKNRESRKSGFWSKYRWWCGQGGGGGNHPCVQLEIVEVLQGEINGSLFFRGLGKISLYLCAHHIILFISCTNWANTPRPTVKHQLRKAIVDRPPNNAKEKQFFVWQ